MKDCIFCKIANKELPGNIVYEDEEVIAFRDINPVAPIHILIIPKKHIGKLTHIAKEDEAVIGRIYSIINNIAETEGINERGFRVIVNCGEEGGQVVEHLHFHLIGGRPLGAKICN
ncbi:MAG: histidine triad nucleotide-binding protein [Firmicutes bacterium]|nr:histidine triad nucleotide-binding protein [Bacillota bacterium]